MLYKATCLEVHSVNGEPACIHDNLYYRANLTNIDLLDCVPLGTNLISEINDMNKPLFSFLKEFSSLYPQ